MGGGGGGVSQNTRDMKTEGVRRGTRQRGRGTRESSTLEQGITTHAYDDAITNYYLYTRLKQFSFKYNPSFFKD